MTNTTIDHSTSSHNINTSDNTIYSSFAKAAGRQPDAPAIYTEDAVLTFAQLSGLTNAIAGKFPQRADFIGIVTDHGAAQIASIFAVLKQGAAYVPAEPDFPEERIRFMMKETGAAFIITQRKYAGLLDGFPLLFLDDIDMPKPAPAPSTAASPARPESDAYVLYTSGSTGVPKGVVVTNRNVCHYVRAFRNEFHPHPGDVMLQYSVCSFDIFVEEVFTTLLSGAALAIPPAETKQDHERLGAFVEEKKVTIISGFPYLLVELNRLDRIPSSLRLLISGGDVLRERYVTRLLPQVEVYNTYGPSETTVCACYFRCNGQKALADGTYSIGKAVLGTSVKILNEQLEEVRPGETGEICIFGDGVSDGYLDKSKNEMFVTLPDGTRFYRSGDLGYVMPDGNIAFLHRRDTQVMILGKRVEPDEVQNVLGRCRNVRKGVVRPAVDEDGLSYLTAYVVPDHPGLRVSELRAEMAKYLTPFMIPEFFVLMNDIPLTPNGKPDTGELPTVLKAGTVK